MTTSATESPKFGMFMGVFTPSVLTILGVIMYLRFGWVVTHAGLGGALLIVATCGSVAFITALSASAVATNMVVGTGGEYYLISRSLGLTIGGAIGIPLFLCRTLSVTLYCFGLAEALCLFWPAAWGAPPLQWLAAALIVLTTLIAGKSADISLKIQLPLMGLVGLSLLALTLGVFTGPLQAPVWQGDAQRLTEVGGFWRVLAVFFPAVTGFTAGIGLSGDLRNPKKDIPRGTLLALGTGLLIYLLLPVILSLTRRVTPAELADITPGTPPVWTRIAVLGVWLVMPGMWSAILSSAFGSALAGPRVLQALALDGLAPARLARVSRTGQPVLASLVGGIIALSAVALGNLNAVARMVTIFFLTLYVSINLVAATESLVGNPSYRPTLRVPWYLSLLGAAGAMVVMFLISPWACVVAIGLEVSVWLFLRRRDLRASWGDVRAGVWGSLARCAIRQLRAQRSDPRNWRPDVLLFADRVEERAELVRIAALLNQNRGVMTVCDLVVDDEDPDFAEISRRQESLAAFLQREGIAAFGEVDQVPQFEAGILSIAQANGMGPLRANTVVFGWPQRRERLAAQLAVIRQLHQLHKAAVIIRPGMTPVPRRYRRIDVWWRGRQNNGDLMLLLAHLMRLDVASRGGRITLRSIVTTDRLRAEARRGLDELISAVRIAADSDVIVKGPDEKVAEIIQRTSAEADLVFLGLRTPGPGEEATYAEELDALVSGLPTTLLVRSSGPFQGRLLE